MQPNVIGMDHVKLLMGNAHNWSVVPSKYREIAHSHQTLDLPKQHYVHGSITSV